MALALSLPDQPDSVLVVGQDFDVVFIVAILDRFICSSALEVVCEHAQALGQRGA